MVEIFADDYYHLYHDLGRITSFPDESKSRLPMSIAVAMISSLTSQQILRYKADTMSNDVLIYLFHPYAKRFDFRQLKPDCDQLDIMHAFKRATYLKEFTNYYTSPEYERKKTILYFPIYFEVEFTVLTTVVYDVNENECFVFSPLKELDRNISKVSVHTLGSTDKTHEGDILNVLFICQMLHNLRHTSGLHTQDGGKTFELDATLRENHYAKKPFKFSFVDPSSSSSRHKGQENHDGPRKPESSNTCGYFSSFYKFSIQLLFLKHFLSSASLLGEGDFGSLRNYMEHKTMFGFKLGSATPPPGRLLGFSKSEKLWMGQLNALMNFYHRKDINGLQFSSLSAKLTTNPLNLNVSLLKLVHSLEVASSKHEANLYYFSKELKLLFKAFTEYVELGEVSMLEKMYEMEYRATFPLFCQRYNSLVDIAQEERRRKRRRISPGNEEPMTPDVPMTSPSPDQELTLHTEGPTELEKIPMVTAENRELEETQLVEANDNHTNDNTPETLPTLDVVDPCEDLVASKICTVFLEAQKDEMTTFSKFFKRFISDPKAGKPQTFIFGFEFELLKEQALEKEYHSLFDMYVSSNLIKWIKFRCATLKKWEILVDGIAKMKSSDEGSNLGLIFVSYDILYKISKLIDHGNSQIAFTSSILRAVEYYIIGLPLNRVEWNPEQVTVYEESSVRVYTKKKKNGYRICNANEIRKLFLGEGSNTASVNEHHGDLED